MMPMADPAAMTRNIALYPWVKAALNLLFWQSIWFLYFQSRLSAADAILLYTLYDLGTIAFEVPSGYLSDRLGRRPTLILACLAGFAGTACLALGQGLAVFAAGQLLIGASSAFVSGTDAALLYESLAATGRQAELEAQELRAWRAAFFALALSAASGGAMALWSPVLPFWANLLAFLVAGLLCLRLTEPRHATTAPEAALLERGALRAAFAQPVLRWLFALSMAMYVFSHVPFVFGQPFILIALTQVGLAAQTPAISGLVTALMMLLSVGTSLLAPRLRLRLGLPAILLLAFALQIAICGLLTLSSSALAIGFLLLRMVPSSLSRPFLTARMQPLLRSETRATYLSLQSFAGRLVLAASLLLAMGPAGDAGAMAFGEIRLVLGCYAAAGLVALGALWAAARGRGIEPAPVSA